ncbi:MAG: PEGA domain-containing protein [Candidatus Curtissbacteria bacterium]|nr:PEGA domain-containing protein [Candidatus Curtissbacteria bacterium]
MSRKLLHVTCYLTLVTLLTGCTVVGGPKAAALKVTSTPQSSIFLDGKHVGKTPFFSDQLKDQEYMVKITAGEATYVEKVTLVENTLTVVNRELNNNFLAQSGEILSLQPGKKGIFVTSTPDEADVAIDGKSYGKTPIQIEEIEEGEHKLILSHRGYLERTITVKTSPDFQVVAHVTLASEIAKGVTAAPGLPEEPEKVEILATPLGFLRVRRESTLTSPEIGRVKTGDQLEILQEIQGWVQIKFEGKQGWVSTEYTKKLPRN